MKKILLLLFTTLQLFSFAQEKTIVLKGTIKNIPKEIKYMIFDNHGQTIIEDTIRNGEFRVEYKTNVELPISGGFVLGDSNRYMKLYLCEGITEINGDGINTIFWIVKNNSPEQQEQNLIKEASLEIEKVISETEEKLSKAIKLTGKNSDETKKLESILDTNLIKNTFVKIDYLKINPPKTKAGLSEFERCLISLKYDKTLDKYTTELKEIFSRVDPKLKNSKSGKIINQLLSYIQNLKVNDLLIDAEFKNMNGTMSKLSDFKGKYMLLDFWSYGCGPCISASDELANIQKNFNHIINIVGINLDSEKIWKEEDRNHKIGWVNLNDELGMQGGYASHFEMKGIPTYILVNPEGKIIEIVSGYGKGLILSILKKYTVI